MRVSVFSFLGFCVVFPSSAFGDSHGKFPGKGSQRAWHEANDLEKQGNLLADQGKKKEAMQYYRKAIAHYPFESGYHFNLGIELQNGGLLKEAENSYKLAVSLEPGFAYAWNNLANVYLAQKRLALAEEAAKKGFYFKRDSFEEASTLAEVYAAEGRYSEAYSMLMIANRCPDANEHKAEYQKVLEDVSRHLKTAGR